MKQLLTFMFLISFCSCTHEQNDLIDEFENSLGEIETKYLNELVNDFDSFLNKKIQRRRIQIQKIFDRDF